LNFPEEKKIFARYRKKMIVWPQQNLYILPQLSRTVVVTISLFTVTNTTVNVKIHKVVVTIDMATPIDPVCYINETFC